MKYEKFHLLNRRAGFTLVELLVVVLIVVLLLSIAFGVLRLGIVTQRSAGAKQVLLDQVSFAAEYASRSLRYAKKANGTCTVEHYEITGAAPQEGIRFLNAAGECVNIYLSAADGLIYEQKDSGIPRALTSNDLEVTALHFVVTGVESNDEKQPRVTFIMQAKPRQGTEEITLQKTISQRLLDN